MKKILSCLIAVIAVFGFSACSSDEMDNNMGYLKLEINTLVSTISRAGVPDGYDGKVLHVEIVDASNKVVMKTDDVENDANFKGNIVLAPGNYTINASSARWDGSDSGFDAPYYAGTTSVQVAAKTLTQAKLTLTQANVKVTVKFDDSFRTYFSEAQTLVSSVITSVAPRTFVMGQTSGSAYFPVADLKFMVNVVSKSNGMSHTQNNTINGVKARDHYIVNYKVADAGSLGGVHVSIDDATQSYSYTIEVPRKSSTSLMATAANAWSNFAYLKGTVTAKTADFNASSLSLQWQKEGDASWNNVPLSQLTPSGEDNYNYQLTGLQPGTTYRYRMSYNNDGNEIKSNEVVFQTETMSGIYNNGFENWYTDGKIEIAGLKSDAKYWNTSNAGAATFIGSVTTQDTSFKHSGNSSAKLATKWAVVKLAAASIFTGDFVGLIGTNGAKLDWGVPFTSRPSALTGYLSYAPGTINRGNKPSVAGAPDKNASDQCQIFCALTTELFKVANANNNDGYELSTAIDWQNDPRVIAYGELTKGNSSNGIWEKFVIPLVYRDVTAKPTHMIIVCSSSKYGDYFYGSDSSVLHIDDIVFDYGTPTTK